MARSLVRPWLWQSHRLGTMSEGTAHLPFPIRVLSLSEDPQLGPLRAYVLRHAGYSVAFPNGRAETFATIERDTFDVLVIGHSIPTEHARDYAAAFRTKNLAGKVLVVAHTQFTSIKAEKTIRAIDGPEVLIAAVAELAPVPDSTG